MHTTNYVLNPTAFAAFGTFVLWFVIVVAVSKFILDCGTAIRKYAEARLKWGWYDDGPDDEPYDEDKPEAPHVEDAKVVMLKKPAA
jgi:hypothetical protein